MSAWLPETSYFAVLTSLPLWEGEPSTTAIAMLIIVPTQSAANLYGDMAVFLTAPTSLDTKKVITRIGGAL
jgi:hypothetical protein